MPLKIITINTWKGDGEYSIRMRLLADQLRDLKPHIIACQECFKTTEDPADTVTFLSQALNMNGVFTPARFKKRSFHTKEVDSYSGLGVLSSYPLNLIKEINLPFAPADGERKAQVIAVTIVDDINLLLVNIHLTHLPLEKKLRLEQLKTIVREIVTLQNYTFKVICGDFNADKNSAELNFLKRILNTKDCYALGHGSDMPLKNNFQLIKTVDHILVLPARNGQYPFCSNASHVLNMPDVETGLYPSDHPGISATLHLTVL